MTRIYFLIYAKKRKKKQIKGPYTVNGAGFKMGIWFVPAQPRIKPGATQSKGHIFIHVVPGKLVTERIGLENSIVL